MTLIELMVAMTLGLLIVLGVTTLFSQNRQSYRQDEMIARMQEDARFALNAMVDDIQLAGFWADVFDPSSVARDDEVVNGTVDCSGTTAWLYVATQPAVVYDHAASTNIADVFDCIPNANRQANTDAIAMNRVEGQSNAAMTFADTIYLKSNGTQGVLLGSAMADTTITGTINYWRYTPKVYYVRNHADTAGDGVPTLCMFEMPAEAYPDLEETCIAEGVESLQMEYGIDTDTDGVANLYIDNPTTSQLQSRLVSVRLHLLMRSVEPDFNYTNNKTYSLGNLTSYAPGDNFYRRVYTTTVLVRNTRNLRCMITGCP